MILLSFIIKFYHSNIPGFSRSNRTVDSESDSLYESSFAGESGSGQVDVWDQTFLCSDFNKNMRKLIKRVDALETRMIPSYQPVMFGGRLQNFPSLPQHHHHPLQHLPGPGPLYPGARVAATPRQGYSPSHVEEELYQTKQWLKQRTLNLT